MVHSSRRTIRFRGQNKLRVLITGGAGFIGSHLCDRFLRDGHAASSRWDNLITGTQDNIAHLAGNRAFEFIYHDVSNFIHVPDH